jgi:predicted DNA-binding transcriptional regulator AlpA
VSDSLLRLPEVLKRTGLSKSHFYRLIAEKKFQPPCKEGSISTWPESEVTQYIEKLKASRMIH